MELKWRPCNVARVIAYDVHILEWPLEKVLLQRVWHVCILHSQQSEQGFKIHLLAEMRLVTRWSRPPMYSVSVGRGSFFMPQMPQGMLFK